MGSETLLPPPPLRSFADGINFASWHPEREHRYWTRGEVDARACVHCTELTFAHHTPLVTQTNLKTAPPPFLEDIQRDMRVVVQNADHVVLMGYSLPSDDIVYRAFLAARKSHRQRPVRCSVVTRHPHSVSGWTYLDSITGITGSTDLPDVVLSAKSLFGRENVRFHGGGFPAVVFDGGTSVTEAGVERLLHWNPV